jgi:hypothetical protein
MPDVIIRRCTLRVVRRGGWSWGEDPYGFARAAVRALETLLARHLAEVWRDEPAEEILTNLKLTLCVRAVDLPGMLALDRAPDDPQARSLHERFRAALALALNPSAARPAAQSETRVTQALPSPSPPGASAPPPEAPEALWSLLIAWQRRGVLEAVLESLESGAIATFLATLRRAAPPARPPLVRSETARRAEGDDGRPVVTLLDQLFEFFSRRTASTTSNPAATLRARVSAAVAAVTERSAHPGDPALWEALDRAWPIDSETMAVAARARAEPGVESRQPVAEADRALASAPVAYHPHRDEGLRRSAARSDRAPAAGYGEA